MAVSMSPKQKVYQGVLQEIRLFIASNDLTTGDKLPSERELSETLQAGRSSIREALRAMELLGLIETRHGEGTYLSMYRPYQTIELLSSFILQENNTKRELLQTKRILEKEAAILAYNKINEYDIEELEVCIKDVAKSLSEKHTVFFQYLFKKTENLLLTKVWQLMEEFSHTLSKLDYDEAFYVALIRCYSEKKFQSIETLFTNTAPSYFGE